MHRTAQLTNLEECWPCPVFKSYTLAFALQLREKHGKNSVRIAEEYQLAQYRTGKNIYHYPKNYLSVYYRFNAHIYYDKRKLM
jgi:hypothetical protein